MSTQIVLGHIPERTIGRRLRDAREDANLSQIELARATGLGRRSITRYESARTPGEVPRKILPTWALATGVPVEWLATGDDPRPGGGPDGVSVTAS